MSNKTNKNKTKNNKTKKNISEVSDVSVNMLKNVCSESNECIMFGKEVDNIFVFFENFENF